MTDLIQSAVIAVLAVTCIVQSISISNLNQASRLHSEAINVLSGGSNS